MATGLLGTEVIPQNPLLNPRNLIKNIRLPGLSFAGAAPAAGLLTAFYGSSGAGADELAWEAANMRSMMSAQDVINAHLSEGDARAKGLIIPPESTVTEEERRRSIMPPNIPAVDQGGYVETFPEEVYDTPVVIPDLKPDDQGWREEFPIEDPSSDSMILHTEGLLKDEKKEEKVNEGILGEFKEGEGMLVIHNTGASAIENYNKIGGIPKPSLAIIPEDIEELNFGEITLIGDPELMIPSGQNPVYKGDAYTQRYPIVRTLYSDDEMNKIIKYFSDALGVENVQYDYDKLSDYKHDDGSRQSIVYAGNIQNEITETGLSQVDQTMLDMVFLKEKGLLPDTSEAANAYKYKDLLGDAIYKNGLTDEFQQWRENLAEHIGVQGKEKIIVGHTDMGRLKYKDHTLDNVLQHMKTKAGKEVGFGATSVGSLAAIMRGKFKTKKELSKARSSLVSSTEMNDIKSKLYSDLYALTEKLTEENEFLKDRNTDLADNFINIFSDKKYSIESSFKEFYPHTSEVTKKEVIKFLEKLADTPTEYFEVKPNRAVGIHEFKGAIVPMNTDEKTLQILRDNGIEIKKYNTEKDRINKLKEFEDLFASLQPNPLFQFA